MPLIRTSPVTSNERQLRISSPLEAGESLLDHKQLPAHLTSALEYVSSRLLRKRLHISLIMVPRDVQIPYSSSTTSPTHANYSPTRSLFSTALRRGSSRNSLSNISLPSSPSSPTFSPSSPTPSRSDYNIPLSPNPYGISLVPSCPLTSKAEKILRYYIQRAEQKFHIGTNWLPTHSLTQAPSSTETRTLIQRSIAQNNIIFTSEGLSLYSLDPVYTFKSSLHVYSSTLTVQAYNAAIQELHRLVLFQSGRRISKAYLLRSYDWLEISLAALVDVNEGYRKAYGGPSRCGGIDVYGRESGVEEKKNPLVVTTSFEKSSAPVREVYMESPKWKVGMVPFEEAEEEEKAEKPAVAPVTPNGFEDITPVTRGEWLCLMVGDGWMQREKTVPIITC